MRIWQDVVSEARALAASRLGLHFPAARQADLERGLIRAYQTTSLSDPEAYLAWLATLPDESPEWRRLAGHLTVGETYFFRDGGCFEALEQHVLPALIAARRAQGDLRLRLWSAGCATGEEPYSLVILLDQLLPAWTDWAFTMLATDINPEALETAQRGIYREWSFRGTPRWVRDRYFHRRGRETFGLDPRIRRMVTFAPLNLAEDGYPSVVTNTTAMDLILCRNVLMYFTREAQAATVARLQRALVPEGWLAVSPAEASAELFRPLIPVNFPGAIFHRKEPAGEQSLGIGRSETEGSGWSRLLGHLTRDSCLRSGEPCLPTLDASVPAASASTILGAGTADQQPAAEFLASLSQPPIAGPQPSLLERARALADEGKLREARHLCEAALAQDRLDPEAHLLLAAICQERGEIPAALEALRRVIYLAPDSARAHFLLGSLLLQQGERKRGRRCMETAVSLLGSVPRDETLPGSDGLTAGRLLETARAYLEIAAERSGAGDWGPAPHPRPRAPGPRPLRDG